MKAVLYHYPKCSSCVKARKFISKKKLKVEERDISQKAPSQAELKKMLGFYEGNIKKLFNTSGMLYREMNIKDTLPEMTEKEAIKLLSENGMLVKRPFLLQDDIGLLGFKEAEWKAVK